jgi:hypothetical protein
MGKIRVRREDGSTFEVRTNVKTRSVQLAHEKPVAVDFTNLGNTPALTEIGLNYQSTLESLDLAPFANHPALTSFRATVADVVDLTPLATCRALTSLSLTIGGSRVLDFTPLHGHPTLADVAVSYSGSQTALPLDFARELPALTSIHIAGGDWTTLDLEPVRGLPLRSVTLIKQYITKVDLAVLAQPALEHLMLQELEINEGYLDLLPLAACKQLRFLSLLGAEVGTLEVSGLAKLEHLTRFDPPNYKSMMMSASMEPITSPGLQKWRDSIGVD